MKKFVIIAMISVLTLVVVFAFNTDTNKIVYASDSYVAPSKADVESDYLSYIEKYEQIFPDETVVIDATKYDKSNSYKTDDETYLDGPDFEVNTFNGKTGLFVPEEGIVSWLVEVPESGYYNIQFDYYTSSTYYLDQKDHNEVDGRSANYSKGIKIAHNSYDEAYYPFKEAKSFSFSRTWVDLSNLTETRVENRNDIKPKQEEKSEWKTTYIEDDEGYYLEPYCFYFVKGTNRITFTSNREPMVISEIRLFNKEKTPTYNEYLDKYKNATKINSDYLDKIQAEEPYSKTSAILTAQSDNSSSKVEPYDNQYTRLNIIGGESWQTVGDTITWQINAPKAGLYNITLKFLQNYTRGMTSNRMLYINGEIPFEEMKALEFSYKGDWQNMTLGNEDGDYWFYLNEGENYLSLKVNLGNYKDISRQMDSVINEMNTLYRDIIVITTTNPDTTVEYFLTEKVDNLNGRLKNIKSEIESIKEQMIKYAGTRSDKIGPLDRCLTQLKKFLKDTYNITKGLAEFKENISALGTWIIEIKAQYLALDTIMVHGEDADIPKASSNFFQKLWRQVVLFVGSFIYDYDLQSNVTGEGETIEVWTSLGRDQVQVIRQMIDETFTPEYGINVKLKLVNSGVLLPATVAGNGPDVSLNVGENIPVNYGIRNAIYDLTQFSDFEEVASRFYDSAMTPYCHTDYWDGKNLSKKCYGLPEQHIFLTMFYRTDILDSLNLEVPKTWKEVEALVIELQQKNLEFYIPSGGSSPVLYSLMFQNGAELYSEGGKISGFNTPEAIYSFEYFTDFFSNYGLTISAVFSNRFRSGEMPIGIEYYTAYNTLSVFAPEISGEWQFALLPGVEDENGNINNVSYSSTTGIVIMESSKYKNESWEFLKWWTDETTQTTYAREMESILGPSGRYPVSNKAAFDNLPWPSKEYRVLKAQMENTEGAPVVPGSYIVGRYIENAFRAVYNDGENAKDVLYENYIKINKELTRKRKEFDLPVKED